MGWSFLRGHYCDPAAVRSGYCSKCKTTWTYTESNWQLTKSALKGNDVRNEKGERFPLI